MILKKIFFIIIFLILFISCASIPKQDQIMTAYYGNYPNNYQQIIMNFYSDRLFDPYTAVYEFNRPLKGWNSSLSGFEFGWQICGTINAKNRLGAYVGSKLFYFLIRDDQIIIFDNGWSAKEYCSKK